MILKSVTEPKQWVLTEGKLLDLNTLSHTQHKVSKLSTESQKTPTAENIKHNSSAWTAN
jgi:hypothetical protein